MYIWKNLARRIAKYMYVYICIYIYTCINICIFEHLARRIQIYIYVYTLIHIYVEVYTYIHLCIYIYTQMHVHILQHVARRIHIDLYTYRPIYIKTYIHIVALGWSHKSKNIQRQLQENPAPHHSLVLSALYASQSIQRRFHVLFVHNYIPRRASSPGFSCLGFIYLAEHLAWHHSRQMPYRLNRPRTHPGFQLYPGSAPSSTYHISDTLATPIILATHWQHLTHEKHISNTYHISNTLATPITLATHQQHISNTCLAPSSTYHISNTLATRIKLTTHQNTCSAPSSTYSV